MASAPSLNEFRQAIFSKGGYLPQNKFLVTMPIPSGLRNLNSNIYEGMGDVIQFYIERVNLPGVQVTTTDVYRYGYGVVQKKPYSATFADLTMSVHSDQQGLVLRFFQNWIKMIFNYDFRGGSMFDQTGILPSQLPYELSYMDDYVVDMSITVFNYKNEPALIVNLHNAFPIFVGDVGLNWADNSQIMRIPVTFTYRNWQTDDLYASKDNFKPPEEDKEPKERGNR